MNAAEYAAHYAASYCSIVGIFSFFGLSAFGREIRTRSSRAATHPATPYRRDSSCALKENEASIDCRETTIEGALYPTRCSDGCPAGRLHGWLLFFSCLLLWEVGSWLKKAAGCRASCMSWRTVGSWSSRTERWARSATTTYRNAPALTSPRSCVVVEVWKKSRIW